MAADILVVDDEADIRELVAGILDDEGYQTRTAQDAKSAYRVITERKPNLLILDIWLQGSSEDGLEILARIKEQYPDLPVIMISGHGNIETAVLAIKKGAYDFIEKPFKADRLVLIVARALEAARLRRQVSELTVRSGAANQLIGTSAAIQQLNSLIEKVAPTGSRVMITGQPGTGKELVARLIHENSNRKDAPFVAINAASIAPERMEEELFGIEKNGHGPRKVGVFEEAHGGTLFLDEIADMPLETQGKILRVLVDQTFQRVGGGSKVVVDVRVMCSTCRDLRTEIEAGRFREDLFHRLNVVPIHVPPLTERREDVPLLARHFVAQLIHTAGLPQRTIGVDVMAAMQAHNWPGNARQLKNNVERLLILAAKGESDTITTDMLPGDVIDCGPQLANGSSSHQIMALCLREARELFEREYLEAQIKRFGGNISRTASFIGMERSALHRKLKSLGVSNNARNKASHKEALDSSQNLQ